MNAVDLFNKLSDTAKPPDGLEIHVGHLKRQQPLPAPNRHLHPTIEGRITFIDNFIEQTAFHPFKDHIYCKDLDKLHPEIEVDLISYPDIQ